MNLQVVRFGALVAERLDAVLGGDFVGACFVGSVALGGSVPGESDVDIVAVTALGLDDEEKRSIAKALLDVVGGCPARSPFRQAQRRPRRGRASGTSSTAPSPTGSAW